MFACKVVYLWKYPRRVLPVHETALRSVRSERECYLQVWCIFFKCCSSKYDVKKKKKRFLWKKNTLLCCSGQIMLIFFMCWHKVNKYCLVALEDFSSLHEAAPHTRLNIYFKRYIFFTSCLQITSKELLLHSVCAPIYGYSLKKSFSDRTLKHRKAGAS